MSQSASYAPPERKESSTAQDISVLLIGFPGSGKSTLGNILTDSPAYPDENFPTSNETDSYTMECKHVWHNFEGTNIVYVDTPGFPDTSPDKVGASITFKSV